MGARYGVTRVPVRLLVKIIRRFVGVPCGTTLTLVDSRQALSHERSFGSVQHHAQLWSHEFGITAKAIRLIESVWRILVQSCTNLHDFAVGRVDLQYVSEWGLRNSG